MEKASDGKCTVLSMNERKEFVSHNIMSVFSY